MLALPVLSSRGQAHGNHRTLRPALLPLSGCAWPRCWSSAWQHRWGRERRPWGTGPSRVLQTRQPRGSYGRVRVTLYPLPAGVQLAQCLRRAYLWTVRKRGAVRCWIGQPRGLLAAHCWRLSLRQRRCELIAAQASAHECFDWRWSKCTALFWRRAPRALHCFTLDKAAI